MRPPSRGFVSGEFDHAEQHCLDRIVLTVPYNRNGAQKPVKRCKSSNFESACDYAASGLTLPLAASDLPQFTNSYYSAGDPHHRVGDHARACRREKDALNSAPSIGNANTVVTGGFK